MTKMYHNENIIIKDLSDCFIVLLFILLNGNNYDLLKFVLTAYWISKFLINLILCPTLKCFKYIVKLCFSVDCIDKKPEVIDLPAVDSKTGDSSDKYDIENHNSETRSSIDRKDETEKSAVKDNHSSATYCQQSKASILISIFLSIAIIFIR